MQEKAQTAREEKEFKESELKFPSKRKGKRKLVLFIGIVMFCLDLY